MEEKNYEGLILISDFRFWIFNFRNPHSALVLPWILWVVFYTPQSLARAVRSKLHWAEFHNPWILAINAMRYLSSKVPQDGTKDGCSMLFLIFCFRANFLGMSREISIKKTIFNVTV